ncbi:hypothetical protein GCM10010168_71220 [Actinoplanes ianthinogenes]|uniref:HEAT repeat protein n=1 Tax=Actinoplanes ianthinogenes TaxID=122358 RepID=A0ABM7M6S4_9ACTN|nr:hypothetical protein [Actinoplanes ianthinogenes]BCJ47289.1 hypothetical protein Aiant_79460 [Actinoplanes ianthinogenes]GGR42224.1 hypothetical protein GCM10010168_71220 [Actinoplanes ianthinogenes]
MTETRALRDADWATVERGFVVWKLLSDLAGSEEITRTRALRDLRRLAPDGEDVRPWVVTALPILLDLVTDGEQPDRGRILRLIGDLAGADRTWQLAGETLRAKQVLAGHPGLTELLSDEDPQVREAAAYTLRAVTRLAPGVLWDRYVEEPEPAVRVTLIRSCVLAGAVGSGYEPTKRRLAWVAGSDADLRVRITALTELMALLNPPPFDVETARDTLLAAYREGLNREPEPLDDEVAPLLAGRRMAARQWTPGYNQVLSAIRATYRNDAAAHLDLIERMLELDAWDAQQDALHAARPLVQRLRGDYRAVVARAAGLLRDGEPQVRAAALRLLHGVDELARPAADAVWASLPTDVERIRPNVEDGPFVWVTLGAQGPELGPAVQLLAALRDERVLPMLERLLDEVPETIDLHRAVAGYGVRARGTSRTLRRHLRALRPETFAEPWRYETHRANLLRALAAVAPNEAGEHLADKSIDVATLGLLARAGRAAAGRLPDIEATLTCGDPVLELAAARAVWLVAGDAEAATGVYDRYFDDPAARPEHAVAAIDGLKELGIRVKSRTRRLSGLTGKRTDGAVAAAAADALWWIAGKRDAAQRLGRVWETKPLVRPRIARLWVETGDTRLAARHAQAELRTALRHNLSAHGVLTGKIGDDERLLDLCRKLAGIPR